MQVLESIYTVSHFIFLCLYITKLDKESHLYLPFVNRIQSKLLLYYQGFGSRVVNPVSERR
nr:MAG TPA: hypothetical protein [Caudoviricetes sp.]